MTRDSVRSLTEAAANNSNGTTGNVRGFPSKDKAQCLPQVKRWFKDDNQNSWYFMFVNTPAESCKAGFDPNSIRTAKDATTLNLALRERFPPSDLGQNTITTINRCADDNDPNGRDFVAKYYMAQARLREGMARSLESISAIDAILPPSFGGPASIVPKECNGSLLFDLKEKCDALRSCPKSTATDRTNKFQQLSFKVVRAAKRYELLGKLEAACGTYTTHPPNNLGDNLKDIRGDNNLVYQAMLRLASSEPLQAQALSDIEIYPGLKQQILQYLNNPKSVTGENRRILEYNVTRACSPSVIQSQRDQILKEYPLIGGDEFQKIRNEAPMDYQVIQKAMAAQLKANRIKLEKLNRRFAATHRCISGYQESGWQSTVRGSSVLDATFSGISSAADYLGADGVADAAQAQRECSPRDLNDVLSRTPFVPDRYSTRAQSEANILLQQQQCAADLSKAQNTANNTLTGAAVDIGLLLGSGGLAAVAKGGSLAARVSLSAQSLTRISRANLTIDSVWAAQSATAISTDCIKTNTDISLAEAQASGNSCPILPAEVVNTTSNYNSCVQSAMLGIVDFVPLGAALAVARNVPTAPAKTPPAGGGNPGGNPAGRQQKPSENGAAPESANNTTGGSLVEDAVPAPPSNRGRTQAAAPQASTQPAPSRSTNPPGNRIADKPVTPSPRRTPDQRQEFSEYEVTRRYEGERAETEGYAGGQSDGVEFIRGPDGEELFAKIYPERTGEGTRDAEFDALLENEAKYARIASDAGVGPKYKGTFVGEDGRSRIVYEKIDGVDLDFKEPDADFLKTLSPDVIPQMREAMSKLIARGANPSDVQFRVGKNGKVYVIDTAGYEPLPPALAQQRLAELNREIDNIAAIQARAQGRGPSGASPSRSETSAATPASRTASANPASQNPPPARTPPPSSRQRRTAAAAPSGTKSVVKAVQKEDGGIIYQVEGDGAPNFTAHPGQDVPTAPRTNPLRGGTAAERQAQLNSFFTPQRRARITQTAAKTDDGRPLEFFRSVSKAELDELLSRGRSSSYGLTRQVTASDRLTPGYVAERLKITEAQARRLLAMPPGPQRNKYLLETAGREMAMDSHNQDILAFDPFKSVSLGPHYLPGKEDEYLIIMQDPHQRAVRNRGGDYEGEWLFYEDFRLDEVVEVLTREEAMRRYGSILPRRRELRGP